MTLTQTAPALAALLVACVTSCHRDSRSGIETKKLPDPQAASPGASASVWGPVHHDVAGLREILELPPEVTECSWVLRQIGDGVLGPSDYFVDAYIVLPSGAVDAAMEDPPHPLQINAELARLLLPSTLLTGQSDADGGWIEVEAVTKPKGTVESASTFFVGGVLRIGHGLWIDAYTM